MKIVLSLTVLILFSVAVSAEMTKCDWDSDYAACYAAEEDEAWASESKLIHEMKCLLDEQLVILRKLGREIIITPDSKQDDDSKSELVLTTLEGEKWESRVVLVALKTSTPWWSKIRDIRKELSIPQNWLADRADVAHRMIPMLESGEIESFNKDLSLAITGKYKIDKVADRNKYNKYVRAMETSLPSSARLNEAIILPI